MSLTDRETLELSELCHLLVEDRLSPEQQARLNRWLAESEDARGYYVRAMALSASLVHYAGEAHAEAPDREVSVRRWWLFSRPQVRWGLALAAGFAVMAVLWVTLSPYRSDGYDPGESVARITATHDAVWGASALAAGSYLHRGQALELRSGFAEITFDSGAQIVLEGPARMDVGSAWDATLAHGSLRANVPEQAIGFLVRNSAVDVVDLGTEFSMVADEKGMTEVIVLRGEVEANPRSSGEPDIILLRENEARRFARSGVSGVSTDDVPLQRLREIPRMDRVALPSNYVRWSFDSIEAGRASAEAGGSSQPQFDATIVSSAETDTVRTAAAADGVRGGALDFDGKRMAEMVVPGLSGASPRTVSFWVKVPAAAQLSDAYAMVAWRADTAALGSRPVHIGWNRNPAEAALGVLRTDFSGGYAVGRTSLRDGRWHFVTVVFIPGQQEGSPVQVKQYVDGVLESNTVVNSPRRSIGSRYDPARASEVKDHLWLGGRIGASGPRRARFKGTIDELVIVERALDPQEIVSLMGSGEAALADAR